MIAPLAEPLDQPACLPDPGPPLGAYAYPHLALVLFALGKPMELFDRPADRRPCASAVAPPHHAGVELRKGAATALGPPRKLPDALGSPRGTSCAVVSDERRRASAQLQA
jgi:hypothetical protein